jgi:glutathione S-transferase
MKPPTLWHIEISHYNEKVRWALDYKGIDHVRKAPLPGLHGLWAAVLTRGGQRRLPVLRLDGRTIGDSTAIIEALESYKPDPPLYPEDPADRDHALQIEDYFDEKVAPAVRRFVWHHTLDDVDEVVDSLETTAPTGRRAQLMRKLVPLMRPVVKRDYKVTEQGAEGAVVEMRAAIDLIERELRPSGYLAGDNFSVADLTAAALLTPVLLPPERQYAPSTKAPGVLELREELEARDGAAWVAEMYAKHRGQSREVAG